MLLHSSTKVHIRSLLKGMYIRDVPFLMKISCKMGASGVVYKNCTSLTLGPHQFTYLNFEMKARMVWYLCLPESSQLLEVTARQSLLLQPRGHWQSLELCGPSIPNSRRKLTAWLGLWSFHHMALRLVPASRSFARPVFPPWRIQGLLLSASFFWHQMDRWRQRQKRWIWND